MQKSVEVFFCYSRVDEGLRRELDKQLGPLRRQGLITLWYDRAINAGTDWQQEVDQHLNTARIILLLVSPDFMDSDYCYGVEMKRAMERYESGEALVIPVILRLVFWKKAPFGKLQALPTDAIPVTSSKWSTREEAFFDIAEGIRTAVEGLVTRDNAEQLVNQGDIDYDQKQYNDALAAYEQALRLDPNNALAYYGQGHTLFALGQALVAYEQVLRLDPHNVLAYKEKGQALFGLDRFEEALVAYGQALRIDPNNALVYYNKGRTLFALERFEKALAAFERALHLDPNNALVYYNKGR